MILLHETVQNPSQDDSIRKYLGFNLKLLSLSGMEFNLNNDRPIKKSRFMQTLRFFITDLLLVNVIILQVNYIIFTVRHRTHERLVTQISSELFSFLLVICKGLRMATTTGNIQTVLDNISVLWTNHKPNRYCRMEIMEAAQHTLNLCKGYSGIGMGVIITLLFASINNFVYYYFIQEARNCTLAFSKRMLLLQYPFEINSLPIFFSVLIEEVYTVSMGPLYWITCDTLFAQLTTHVSIQLKILHYDLQTLINHEILNDRLKANIVIFIKRHQNLLRLCNLIEEIFSPVIFATTLLSAVNICVDIFEVKMTNAEGNYSRTVVHATMATSLFLQILFYCSFAETLTNETSAIAETVYNCKWTEKNHKLRFYLQMVIMKSQSPFYCTAYGFFPIGHARMASIISTSFSYLMILQNIS